MLARIAGKLSRLSLRDWRELFEAQWALARCAVHASIAPHGQPGDAGRLGRRGRSRSHARGAAVALAMVRAARFGVFRPQCLARSVALSRMLTAHGITRWRSSALACAGTTASSSPTPGSSLAGETLGDADEHVGSFVPLTNLDVRVRPELEATSPATWSWLSREPNGRLRSAVDVAALASKVSLVRLAVESGVWIARLCCETAGAAYVREAHARAIRDPTAAHRGAVRVLGTPMSLASGSLSARDRRLWSERSARRPVGVRPVVTDYPSCGCGRSRKSAVRLSPLRFQPG